MENQQIPPQLKLAIEEALPYKCNSCDGLFFDTVFQLKTVSLASVGQAGKYMPVQMPFFRCVQCGEIVNELNTNGKEGNTTGRIIH